MNRLHSTIAIVVAAIGLSACAAEKSSNPLSPTVAGPIPGVNISTPAPAQPTGGARISVDQQPVTLMVKNASTNGVRPLAYLFEVASDAEFSNKIFSKSGVVPGSDGQTTLRLPDPLATGKTYFWRARAEDGANSSAYSAPATFAVFTPIVIQAPSLVAPVGNVLLDSVKVRFTVGNAPRSGPVGPIEYLVELSDTDTFSNVIAAWGFGEQSPQSSLQAPQDMLPGRQYFWRARAGDPTTIGPFSAPQAFRTPAAIVPIPTPPAGGSGGGGGGGGCSGVASDGINFNQAGVYNSPQDLASWCMSAKITSVVFTGGAVLVDFSKRDGGGRWPDSPFGDGLGGTIQYTLGMCLNVNGTWDCSAVVQFWYGRDLASTGPPSQIATNWFYDGRWGPLAGRQPADGENVGLFVCAGNCRNDNVGLNSVIRDRSNVVIVKWSNGGGPSYSF